MSLLRRARAELTGAWRSVRYDMGQRPVEPPPGGPDVTSTGMNTFGVPVYEQTPPPPAARPRRRAVAVTGFGVLTVIGAAGAYLGVVTGLGSLTSQEAVAGTLPPQPAVTGTFTPNAGIGRVPARPFKAAAPAPTVTDPTTGLPLPQQNVSPVRTSPKGINPTTPECACDFPPVPTPTAPSPTAPPPSGSSSAPAPGTSDDPSADPSPSDSADPGETSATPGDSVEPSDSPHYRHRRRYH